MRLRILAATVATISAASAFTAAQPAGHPGLDLCREGRYAESVTALETAKKDRLYKTNSEVWHCLALAYVERQDPKNARKNAEQAAKLSPTNSKFQSNLAYIYLLAWNNSKAQSAASKAIQVDPTNKNAYYFRGVAYTRSAKLDAGESDARKLIDLDPGYPQGYILLADIYIARLSRELKGDSAIAEHASFLKEALDVLKTGKERCKDHPNRGLVDEMHEATEAIYAWSIRDRSTPKPPVQDDPNTTPLRILTKPRPGYTDSARRNNVQGTVHLAVLFGASGRVEFVLPIKRLSDGLDQQAVAAAKKIQFEPKKVGGKAVSVVRLVEYTFSIY